MIKPSDVVLPPATLDPDRLALLESQFDAAIRDAVKWPVVVEHKRDGVTDAEVEHVAARYRQNGWLMETGQSTERVLIDHPARQ